MNGLDEDLRVQLEEFDIRTFRELVERARIIEGAKKRKTRAPKKKVFVFGKRTNEGSSFGHQAKRFKTTGNFRGSSSKKKDTTKTVSCWKCK